MEEFKFIEFQKRRDFSAKMNVTFGFVKQNRNIFLKSVLFIAGPPILIASLLSSSFISDIYSKALGSATNPDGMRDLFLSFNFWAQLALMFIFLIVSYVAVIATTYNFMIVYNDKKGMPIEVNDVWERVRETLWMYFGTALLFGILGILVYVIFLIPIVLLGAISPFLIFFGVVFYFVAIVYVFVSLALVFPIRAFEKKSFFESLSRSFYLVRGKWWSTFGLSIILLILVSTISYVFSIPASILRGISMFHNAKAQDFNEGSGVVDTIAYILNALAYVTQLTLYFLPTIGLAFQFFNLVEMKESKGLLGQIDSLGESQPPPAQEEQY